MAETGRGGIRAYARHRRASGLTGGTHGAVRGAIERGVLTGSSYTREAGAKRATYSIDFAAADQEWAENVDAHQQGRAPKAEGAQPDGSTMEASLPTLQEGKVTMAQAQLVEQVYRAELRRQEWQRSVGLVCDAAGAASEATRIGHVVREAILRVPVRLRALVAAESDPRRCEELMAAELRVALQALAEEL